MVLMRTVMRAGLVALQIACGPGAALAGQALPVSKDQGAQINETDAKDFLADATKRLQKDNGGNDVACNVTLTLQGSLHALTTSHPVDSLDSFEEVCEKPGQIHVVSSLTWCEDLPHPNAVGCSTRPGTCIVVRPPNTTHEGALWAHEYGHNLGLCDVSEEGRIMRQSLADNRVVTRAECNTFELTAAGPATCPQLKAAPDLTTFIRQHYFHGTPYAEARSYRGEVSTLLGYLRNPDYAEYWSNVVLTLGIIGSSEARKPLVEFIETRKKSLSRSDVIDKQSAVVALGYLYRGKADDEILRYLERGLEAAEWRKRLEMPAVKDASDSLPLDRQLTIASLQALGITGSKTTAATLDAFIAKKPDPDIEAVARDAVKLNAKVLASGDSVLIPPTGR